jgi:M6 family metalloprotease-like protein
MDGLTGPQTTNNMKKKHLLTALLVLMAYATALAIPANKRPMNVRQPDGTTVTLQLVGDEWNHYYSTTDGYTLVKDSRGYYTYARLNAALQLVPSTQVAHDEAQRSDKENAFLAGLNRHIMPAMTPETQRTRDFEMQSRRLAAEKMRANMLKQRQARAQAASGRHFAPSYDYSKFRGLIILVEYNDKSFSREDYDSIFNEMVNMSNYTGYYSTNNRKQTYVGSVHDYFTDNSDSLFQPQFDVVGPVKVGYSQYYPQGTYNGQAIFKQAIDRVNATVDFSKYDGDNDGQIDMIYFVVPGFSSSYGGNDSRLLWPHASDLSYYYRNQRYDGKRLGRYACSTEMYGWESQYGISEAYACIDGIGTICHEFSHVLGIMDHYDTDYEAQGQSFHPGEWDIMAGGSDGDRGRQPVGYSLYEKVAMGFAEPYTASHGEDITLGILDTLHNGLRIPSGQTNETFYLENRQKTAKWGKYLPGHGLLVWRIDSTDINQYYYNTLNAVPSHNYVEIVRATPSSRQVSGQGDPFPGSGNKRILTNTSTPANLLSWTKKTCNYELEDIKETSGIVSFELIDLTQPRPARYITMDEQEANIGIGGQFQLHATVIPESHTSTLTWSSSKPSVATVDTTGLVTGVSLGTATIFVRTDNGLSAYCTIHVVYEEPCNDIATFLSLEDGKEVKLMLNDAVVQVKAGNGDLYLYDGTGCVVLSGTDYEAEAGTTLSGSLYCAKTTDTNGLPMIGFVENRSTTATFTATTGDAPQPVRVKMEDLGPQHIGRHVQLWGYLIEAGVKLGTASRVCLVSVQEDQSKRYVPMYNNLGLSSSVLKNDTRVSGHYYSAQGIIWPFTTTNDKGVEYELSLTKGFKDITNDPEWTDIDDITFDRSQQTRIYDLRGVSRKQPLRGVNILKHPDGSASKVVIE